jgi:hypothetical protein
VQPVVADDDKRDVVVWCRLTAERTDVGEQAIEQFLRRPMTVGFDRREQALVGEFFAAVVERFADAVAERDDDVAGLELQRLLVESRMLELSEHHAAGVEPAHTAGRHQERRIVTAV